MNIFQKAAIDAPSPVSKTKKDTHITVDVRGADFDRNLRRLAELDSKIKEMKAEMDMCHGVVLQEGKNTYTDQYTRLHRNPDTFNLKSDSGARVMFVPTDKYLKIDRQRYDDLTVQYGSDAVTVSTDFSFDKDMLEKYADVISRFIMTSEDIATDDRDKIIKAENTFSVKKGAIDAAYTTGKGDVSHYLQDIQYVAQLKNPKLPA